MAVQDYKINYKSDFVLNINGDAGWAVPFCIKFWTGMPSQAYFVGFDGVKYVNCRVGDTPTQLLVMFDDHHLPIGKLKMQIAYHTTIEEFPGSVFDEVTNARDVIVTIDGTDYQVLLDFTGEDAPELEFDLPAYANEAERIQNELQRQQNEAARIAAELQREQATAAAVQGAENVNAQLNGTTLTVTNRQGVSTSVNTKGEQGEQGPVGPEGPQGQKGVSVTGLVKTGETDTDTLYNVTFSDGTTQAVAIPKGAKGDTGATGPTGPQGPQGQTGVSITGLVKTGETETDTLYNVTFSNGTTQAVAIPKGEKGDQGPVGPQGPQGPMGDVAVITPEQQAAFTMYSVPGQNTDGPMTQKAVTDALVAGSISYDNSQSGLAADNVQVALDEVNTNLEEILGCNTHYDGSSSIWLNNGKYIQTNGTLANGSYWSVSKPILIGKDSLITINTQGSGLCVIAQTDVQGSFYTPLVNATSSSIASNRAYEYKATSDIYVALSGKIGLGDVSVVLSVPSKTEKVINDVLDEFSTRQSLLVSGGYIDTDGNIQSDDLWIYTDFIEVDIKSGDKFVWGGIINYTNACLIFYDENKTKKGGYSATGESRDFTVASSVVGAKYIRASFYINSTPFLSINGVEVSFDGVRTVNTDSTMTLDMPANAKGVGEYISNILGISFFKDGYFINFNGNEELSDLWCYAEISLSEPVKAGDVYVWNGIMNNTDASIYFYETDGSHKGGWSATGTSRTFTVGSSSVVIGATKIKASFLISSKDNASVSINGIAQKFSIVKEDKSVAEYNADKQPMITSLPRLKTNFSTTKKYLCFAQITDTHAENVLVQRAVDFINSDEFGSSIDCLVHTGDIQLTSFDQGDMPAFHSAMDNSKKPAFTVLGNHDVYKSTSVSALYERFMKPMVDNGLLVAGTNIDAANYATWYYYDWSEYNVRMIMLNDFDPLYDGYTKPLNTTAYSPSQINFLISTLQSVPSGYTVIILDHFPSNNAENYIGHLVTGGWTCGNQMGDLSHGSLFTGNASPVMDILGAYKSKTALTQSYTYTNSNVASRYGSIDINVDFTSANGTFGFMACGHNHNDLIYTFPHQSDILAVGMLGGVGPTIADSITNIFRSYVGKAHDAINVYCVRTDERKVYVVRIGADFRADGNAQIMTSFEY